MTTVTREHLEDEVLKSIQKKAIDAADELWDKGLIDENTIEQWKHEHMRTPYSE